MIDWNLARLCAELSEESYYGLEKFKKFLFKRVIIHTKLEFFDHDGAQAYGIETPDYVFVIFRGTQPTELSDLIADIKAWPRDSDTVGHVHSGFKGELDKIHDTIVKWLGSTDKQLVICGHSLGAAMATLFASRMHLLGIDLQLYTYGSPRVGCRVWAKQFKTIKAYRFQNTNDIVCTVPPFGYYTHIGQLYYLTYSGKVITGFKWYQRTYDKLRGRVRALAKREVFSGLYDHIGFRYIDKISNKK
mgnify:FL=1